MSSMLSAASPQHSITMRKITKKLFWDDCNQQLRVWVSILGKYSVTVYFYESPILQHDQREAKYHLRQVERRDFGVWFADFLGKSI